MLNMKRLEPKDLRRLFALLLACYLGALCGQLAFHIVTARRLDLGRLSVMDIVALALGPIGVIGVAIVTLGPNLIMLASIVVGVLFQRRSWPISLAAQGVGFPMVAFGWGAMWGPG